jgi:hypothetical protein
MPEIGAARLTDEHLNVVRFCAIECEMQMSGERSVGWMVEAWCYAQRAQRPIVVDDVLRLGVLVEPGENANGYRQVGVRVGWDVKPGWRLVPRQMENLLEAQDRLTPEEFFFQYEEVHPFRDGNGRTGQVLYNWLKGTLHDPDWAPNFWGDDRRLPGSGAPLLGTQDDGSDA